MRIFEVGDNKRDYMERLFLADEQEDIFGRGWCGYACWTAMVLDFLPYKEPKEPRRKTGWIRYITFAASLIFVSALFLAKVGNI